MSLVRRGNSKFWYVQFQLDHKTIIRSTRTTDRKAAEQVASKIRAESHAEIILGRKKPLSLADALDRFTDSKAHQPNHRNLIGHKRAILSIVGGSTSISRINAATFDRFVERRAAQGCSAQTIKHGVNCFAGALRKARRDGYDCVEPVVPTIKVRNARLRYLSVDEERRLLAELDPARKAKGLSSAGRRTDKSRRWLQDNFDLVVLLLDTGARYGEVANLRWDQVDLASQSIKLWRPKVHNESIIFMTDRVASVMERRSQDRRSAYVFCSSSGKARGYSSQAIRKAFNRAGLRDCTIHTLRHTHASRLIQNGMNVYEVRTILGHTDIRTTMRYAHLDDVAVSSKARDVIDAINRA